MRLGPAYGYHPNSSKTYLIVKEEHESKAKELFADTDVHITINGKRHLGAAIGAKSFSEEYVSRKVGEWVNEIKSLSTIALTQPHAAYAAFTQIKCEAYTSNGSLESPEVVFRVQG